MNNISGFDPSTKILMYDNTVKEIQNIIAGDLIWGDDNKHRTVIETFKGENELYLVQQSKAESYITTINHPLVLRATSVSVLCYNQKGRSKDYVVIYYVKCENAICKKNCCKKGFKYRTLLYDTEEEGIQIKNLITTGQFDPAYVKEGDVSILSAFDYLNMCTKDIRLYKLKGYKVPYPVLKNNYKLPLDPYFLGIWLGDGTASRAVVTSTDIEIENFLHEFASTYEGLTVHKKTTEAGYVTTTGPVAKKGYHVYSLRYNKNRLNPIRIALENIGVLNNKHIPDLYLNASEEDRFRLLAGLIDTDGSLHMSKSKHTNKIDRLSYRFSQAVSHKELAFNAYTLAKSLGLNIGMMEETECPPVGRSVYKDGEAFHTNYCFGMTGENITKIPCLIERKKVTNFSTDFNFRTTHTSSLNMIKQDNNNFVGLIIDGNHQFLLSDCSVVHDSFQN